MRTLNYNEFKNGLAEVIKNGMICGYELFEFLEKNVEKIISFDSDCLVHIVKRCCEIKADIVQKDEHERNLRRILNYGHTLGHAIETLTGYKRYKHGEAVAIGMAFAAALSNKLGYFAKRGC